MTRQAISKYTIEKAALTKQLENFLKAPTEENAFFAYYGSFLHKIHNPAVAKLYTLETEEELDQSTREAIARELATIISQTLLIDEIPATVIESHLENPYSAGAILDLIKNSSGDFPGDEACQALYQKFKGPDFHNKGMIKILYALLKSKPLTEIKSLCDEIENVTEQLLETDLGRGIEIKSKIPEQMDPSPNDHSSPETSSISFEESSNARPKIEKFTGRLENELQLDRTAIAPLKRILPQYTLTLMQMIPQRDLQVKPKSDDFFLKARYNGSEVSVLPPKKKSFLNIIKNKSTKILRTKQSYKITSKALTDSTTEIEIGRFFITADYSIDELKNNPDRYGPFNYLPHNIKLEYEAYKSPNGKYYPESLIYLDPMKYDFTEVKLASKYRQFIYFVRKHPVLTGLGVLTSAAATAALFVFAAPMLAIGLAAAIHVSAKVAIALCVTASTLLVSPLITKFVNKIRVKLARYKKNRAELVQQTNNAVTTEAEQQQAPTTTARLEQQLTDPAASSGLVESTANAFIVELERFLNEKLSLTDKEINLFDLQDVFSSIMELSEQELIGFYTQIQNQDSLVMLFEEHIQSITDEDFSIRKVDILRHIKEHQNSRSYNSSRSGSDSGSPREPYIVPTERPLPVAAAGHAVNSGSATTAPKDPPAQAVNAAEANRHRHAVAMG